MKVVIYFDEPGVYDYPLNYPIYKQAYKDLVGMLNNRGIEVYFARAFETYKGDGVFSKSWQYDDNDELVESGEVKADVLYDKGAEDTFVATDVEAINMRDLNILCSDKLKTYELFSDISPATFMVNNAEELSEKLNEISSQKVVLKPNQGFGGSDVRILEKSDVKPDELEYPVLIQQFLDTSEGISELVDGPHDLRLLIVNGEIIASLIREPKEGSLVANIAQGGKLKFIPVPLLPESAFEIFKKVDKELERFGKRVYSADMVCSEGKFYLLELNSRPGINPLYRGIEAERFLTKLSEAIAS